MDLDGPEKDIQDKHDISDMIQRAKENGLPKIHWEAMESLVDELGDFFSNRFSAAPSKVVP